MVALGVGERRFVRGRVGDPTAAGPKSVEVSRPMPTCWVRAESTSRENAVEPPSAARSASSSSSPEEKLTRTPSEELGYIAIPFQRTTSSVSSCQ